jgi:predicted pyridoxine 5'-phosphate oxidase superfamily flavin-nucleotide-binding protein
MSASPFHPGELEAQARAGGGAAGGGIRNFMVEQHRTFFESLPFVVVATVDDGWPAAALLAGKPGFIAAPDPHTLRIATDDPAQRTYVPGAPAGILGIDLATRRRNRANGIIASAEPGILVLDIRQSFGNCPQYIHMRDIQPAPRTPGPVRSLPRLDADGRAAISAADTFFVASAARIGEPEGGVDVSHRGGPRGFVRVEGQTLTIPDYRGNRYFNTLGNLVSNPRAALLFVDFERGDLLHLQGTTEIVWDGPELRSFLAAERLWRFRVERAWRERSALPLRWTRRASGRG